MCHQDSQGYPISSLSLLLGHLLWHEGKSPERLGSGQTQYHAQLLERPHQGRSLRMPWGRDVQWFTFLIHWHRIDVGLGYLCALPLSYELMEDSSYITFSFGLPRGRPVPWTSVDGDKKTGVIQAADPGLL